MVDIGCVYRDLRARATRNVPVLSYPKLEHGKNSQTQLGVHP